VLERFEPESSDDGSDSSSSQLVDWNQLNRRFREVVKDPNDPRTRHLNQAIHHMVCFTQINQHQVNELEQALATKNKRKKPSRALEPPAAYKESGGAVWYSPRSIQRQRVQIAAKIEEERLEELRKIEAAAEKLRQRDIRTQEAARVAEQKMKDKAERGVQEQQKQQDIYHRKFLRGYKKMVDQCRKSIQSQARTRAPRPKVSGGRGGRRKVGGRAEGPVPAPPPLPPPTNRRGRNIKTPARYQ
jgi:flagellar motility protein MotE (MotC chaperone)